MSDPEVTRFRAEISEIDRSLAAAVNRRLELVAALKRYKDEHGIAFVDAGREAELIEARVRDNTGPISDEGLRSFYLELLALIKREL